MRKQNIFCTLSFVAALLSSLLLFVSPAASCITTWLVGNWSSVSWSSCSGTGGLPGSSDDVEVFFCLL